MRGRFLRSLLAKFIIGRGSLRIIFTFTEAHFLRVWARRIKLRRTAFRGRRPRGPALPRHPMVFHPGMNPFSHDFYVKMAEEFKAAVDESSLDLQRIPEKCALNGQTMVRIKFRNGFPVHFDFEKVTNAASDEPAKSRLMKLTLNMRAAVGSSAITLKQSLVDAPLSCPTLHCRRRVCPARFRHADRGSLNRASNSTRSSSSTATCSWCS